MRFQEFDTVRVVKLLAPRRYVSSSFDPAPQPGIGDEGTVVDVSQDRYTVEDVDERGYTRWLADFTGDELELVARAGQPPTFPA